MHNQIKILREKRGWTQNDLADETGLSVRTIQRVESGTIPKGHTLKCLTEVFGDELTKANDNALPEQLRFMNMSCLGFLILPFGNIIFPTFYWFKHKSNPEINTIGRKILNFQISWYIVLAIGFIILIYAKKFFDYDLFFIGSILLPVMIFLNIIAILQASKKLRKNQSDIYNITFSIL